MLPFCKLTAPPQAHLSKQGIHHLRHHLAKARSDKTSQIAAPPSPTCRTARPPPAPPPGAPAARLSAPPPLPPPPSHRRRRAARAAGWPAGAGPGGVGQVGELGTRSSSARQAVMHKLGLRWPQERRALRQLPSPPACPETAAACPAPAAALMLLHHPPLLTCSRPASCSSEVVATGAEPSPLLRRPFFLPLPPACAAVWGEVEVGRVYAWWYLQKVLIHCQHARGTLICVLCSVSVPNRATALAARAHNPNKPPCSALISKQ